MAIVPGRTAHTAAISSRPFSTREVPLIELPASTAELAHDAAARLGWDGVVLPEITMLGRKICVVARLHMDVHAERLALGSTPALDRTTVATWTWPELAAFAPGPAADIVGILTVARHWRTGMAAVTPFARYCPTAMVLPSAAALTTDYINNCLPRARAGGLTIVTANSAAEVELDLAATDASEVLLEEDSIFRWVNEMVYAQLIASYDLPVGDKS